MKFDVTELLNKRKSTLDFAYELMPDGTEDYALLPDGVSFDSPARIDCRAEDVNGYIRLAFDVSVDLKCRCNRCLDEFIYPLDFSFERFAGQSPEQIWGDDGDGMEEDVLDIRESGVFPDSDVMEEISLASPQFALCSDDCEGLCPSCGKKMSSCSCGDKKEEKRNDPRMDVFRDLLRRMEEEEKSENENN